jgi:hypothetical protein
LSALPIKENFVKQIRKRLTYANVMSSIAVFLILGGASAIAANQLGKNTVGTKQLKKNAVTTAKIKKNAITTAKVKAGAITTAKIKAGAITTPEFANGSVTGEKLATNSVTSDKLGNGSVTGAKLAAGAVSGTNLAGNSVGNSQTQLVKVFSAGAVPAAASVGSAPKVELGSVGPFHFYGKCFEEGGEVAAREYIEITSGVGFFSTENSDSFAGPTEYLTSATPEDKRELQDNASAEPNEYNGYMNDEEYQAASGGTDISGLTGTVAAKQGTPPGGNGPFLSGNSCLIGGLTVLGS